MADDFLLDEQAAEAMLNYFREKDIWADESHLSNEELDEDYRRFSRDVTSFFNRYNQSLDWVVRGDPRVMICSRAVQSNNAAVESADPIFAALVEFAEANVAFYANYPDGVIPDEIGYRWGGAVEAVASTRPTTPAGLAALKGWARDQSERRHDDASEWGSETADVLVATIDDATRGMAGLKPWSPPVPVAAPVDPVFELIKAHRATLVAWIADLKRSGHLKNDPLAEAAERICREANDALNAPVIEPATTGPGLMAKLEYFRELLEDHETEWMLDECIQPTVLLNNFTASLQNTRAVA